MLIEVNVTEPSPTKLATLDPEGGEIIQVVRFIGKMSF